jgi:hypothetical protein
MQPTANTTSSSPTLSMKHIHRLIVSSAAYRQTSRITQDHTGIPTIADRARPRLRVEVNRARYCAATSGLLNPDRGPSIFSPAPDFIPTSGQLPARGKKRPDRYRRALHLPPALDAFPALQVFDAPNGDFSCVRRLRWNTLLQTLVSLNETVFVDAPGPRSQDPSGGGKMTSASTTPLPCFIPRPYR